MRHARPLPSYLIKRYHGWKATEYEENKAWFQRLADEGQRPRAMVVSCCDSRLQVSALFGAEQGEFFIHRNIANLVPPHEPDGEHHGTSATIEYAVRDLKVAHLIVIGHSKCGGIKGCTEICADEHGAARPDDVYLTRWLELLRPAWKRVREAGIEDEEERLHRLEKEGVIVSLENLMTFPFVRRAVEEEALQIHGLWTDIGAGDLEWFDPEAGEFVSL